MNLWFYITSIITFSLYIGVYYIDAVSTCFHHISKIVPKWLESSWPRKVLCASPPARTWRVACLRSEIVNRTPNLRRHNDHITIIKNTPPPLQRIRYERHNTQTKRAFSALSPLSLLEECLRTSENLPTLDLLPMTGPQPLLLTMVRELKPLQKSKTIEIKCATNAFEVL